MTVAAPIDLPAALAAATPEQLRTMQIEAIFMPEGRRRRNALYSTPQLPRFVHYTRAEAALSIIDTKRLWLRNTKAMVDYQEVQYGYNLLWGWFNAGDNRATFIQTFDEIHSRAAAAALKAFDDTWNCHDIGAQTQTYIGSVSEHDPSEDDHGRLSMWRAFGADAPARVAFVFQVPPLSGAVEFLKCIFSPVAYLSKARAHEILSEVVANAVTHRDFLKTLTQLELINWLFITFTVAVTCVKHEGFKEEREWRIVYHPGYLAGTGPLMESEVKCLSGVPQIIYKFPIDGRIAPELAGLDFSSMFDRLILGPSQYSWVLYDAFKRKLEEVGVADAGARIATSSITIRS